ncbi:unnamed protein product [marine sediment metagenome]|uniref:Transcription regulator PadR N-terminal domain-containing protein n=1 Tax=marine sediment metagenome TaxID=412755 RepID=X1HCP1_9ZZZZ
MKKGKNWRRYPIILDNRPVYPLGFLIRDVLLNEGEANPYGIYKLTQALKAKYDEMPQFKYRYGTIRSYFYWLRKLGFITLARTVPSSSLKLEPKRYYKLTPAGRKAQDEWFNVRETYQRSLPR